MHPPHTRKRKSSRSVLCTVVVVGAIVGAFFALSPSLNQERLPREAAAASVKTNVKTATSSKIHSHAQTEKSSGDVALSVGGQADMPGNGASTVNGGMHKDISHGSSIEDRKAKGTSTSTSTTSSKTTATAKSAKDTDYAAEDYDDDGDYATKPTTITTKSSSSKQQAVTSDDYDDDYGDAPAAKSPPPPLKEEAKSSSHSTHNDYKDYKEKDYGADDYKEVQEAADKATQYVFDVKKAEEPKKEDYQDYKDYDDYDEQKDTSPKGVDAASSSAASTDSKALADYDDENDYGETDPVTSKPTGVGKVSDDQAFLMAVGKCQTLDCLTKAHEMPRSKNIFNFPHFMILGFQKSATTSLFKHLQEHPQLIPSVPKEPNYFSYRCKYNPPDDCNPEKFIIYKEKILRIRQFLAADGKRGSFEGSTHYVRGGPKMASGLQKTMPWLKLIISMREPISRAASMLIHNRDSQKVGCLYHTDKLDYCLLTRSQINGTRDGPPNYVDVVRPWLEEYPADQVHIIQYEELTESENEENELKRVKDFIGVDNAEPKGQGLGLHNVRRFRIRPEGWKMPKENYLKMLEIVKPDVEALLDLLEKHGKLRSRSAWLERWQQVWDDNLKSCNEEGICNILLS